MWQVLHANVFISSEFEWNEWMHIIYDGVFLNIGLSIRLTFVNIVKQYESETIESIEQSIRQKQYKHSGEE